MFKCEDCQSLVKFDIVFFGESFLVCFFFCMQLDFLKVDFFLVMGIFLQVQFFVFFISKVFFFIFCLFINKEKVGQLDFFLGMIMGFGGGMDFDFKKVYRDVVWLGECDQGCLVFVEFFGWKKELEDFVWREYVSIDVQLGVGVFNFSILVFF